MKKFITTILTILLLCFSLNYSQAISSEEKQNILAGLDSLDQLIIFDSIQKIGKYNITEAIPVLESKIWTTEPENKCFFLKTLNHLGSANTHNIALAILDSANYFDYSNSASSVNPLYVQDCAAAVLCYLGDYSKVDFIFEKIDNCKAAGENYFSDIYLLPDIFKYAPSYSGKAEEYLKSIALTASDEQYRYHAIFLTEEILQNNALPFLLQVFQKDTSVSIILSVLDTLVIKYQSSLPENLLREKIMLSQNHIIRWNCAECLLKYFGTPSNYKYIMNYNTTYEPDSVIYSVINYDLKGFIPAEPSASLSTVIILDTLISDVNQCFNYSWLSDNNYQSDLLSKITSAKDYLIQSDSVNCAKEIKSFQTSVKLVYLDSAGSYPKYVGKDGYKFLYYYSQYILDRLPQIPVDLPVKLVSSSNANLNTGILQYYDGAWKDAINNNDGTFLVNTTLTTVSLRMTYEYGSQTLSNVTVGHDTVIFRTVNIQVKLQSSTGTPLDTGTIQYYAGDWRDFGTTANGVANKELLPNTYNFRMTYEYVSKDTAQDIGTSNIVGFSTVLCTINVQNSQGQPVDSVDANYYSGAWREIGLTSGGIITKELLPASLTFRINYGTTQQDKTQDISTNGNVGFILP